MNTVKIPQIIQPDTPYVRNMTALWKSQPTLAQAVDLVDEADMIECIPTRSGELTCRVKGPAGEDIFLHSRYDPLREAKRWADGVIQMEARQTDEDASRIPMCFIVSGFGLGYHVRELFDRLSGDAFIVISERNMALIRTALHYFDYAEMLESGRIIFITGLQREEIFKKLQPRGTQMMLGTIFTRPLQQVDSEFHSKIHTIIKDFASFMRSHIISLLANSIITCKNILYNLPTYVGTSSIEILHNRFAGKPAVIVSAGPSLKKNISLLREIRDKIVIIAVQTTLKPLLAQGIRPDFVTSLDYHEVSKRFFEGLEDLADIHLVAEPKATWHVADYYRSRGPISLLDNNFANLCLRELDIKHGALAAGATVAHLAFYLAEYIGADPVIFIGQDLGFSNHVYYSPGNALHDIWQGELNRFCTIEMKEWERIVRSRNMLRKVQDIYNQEIYTDEQMFTYLQQFEKDFAQSPARVIDATEGGVKKQNSLIMTLAEAIEKFCRNDIEREKFAYRSDINTFDHSKLTAARQSLQKRLREVEELRDISTETVELVQEMLKLVDEQDKLNRKMIRLDELRTMVKHRQDTYHLVTMVSQAGEMMRYRQDRALAMADDVAGKERQRRQLKRDIAYVTEVKNACERMLEMLKEAVERFDQEIAAADL